MPVVLETERLLLREMLLNDVEPLGALIANPDTMRHAPDALRADGARAWIQSQQESYRERGYGMWAVVHRDSAAFLGQAGLRRREVDGTVEIELGCLLDETVRHQGLGTEAAAAVRDYAWETLHVPRLVVVAHPDDAASRRTAEGLGMRHEKDADVSGRSHAVYSLENERGET